MEVEEGYLLCAERGCDEMKFSWAKKIQRFLEGGGMGLLSYVCFHPSVPIGQEEWYQFCFGAAQLFIVGAVVGAKGDGDTYRGMKKVWGQYNKRPVRAISQKGDSI